MLKAQWHAYHCVKGPVICLSVLKAQWYAHTVLHCDTLCWQPNDMHSSISNNIYQNFEKWKISWISSFYTCVPKFTIIWFMVSEIQSETNIIFCHFGLLFALLPPPLPVMIPKIKILKKHMKKIPGDIILLYIHVCHKWRSYNIWFLKCKVWKTNFYHFGPFFVLSAPWQAGKSKF